MSFDVGRRPKRSKMFEEVPTPGTPELHSGNRMWESAYTGGGMGGQSGMFADIGGSGAYSSPVRSKEARRYEAEIEKLKEEHEKYRRSISVNGSTMSRGQIEDAAKEKLKEAINKEVPGACVVDNPSDNCSNLGTIVKKKDDEISQCIAEKEDVKQLLQKFGTSVIDQINTLVSGITKKASSLTIEDILKGEWVNTTFDSFTMQMRQLQSGQNGQDSGETIVEDVKSNLIEIRNTVAQINGILFEGPNEFPQNDAKVSELLDYISEQIKSIYFTLENRNVHHYFFFQRTQQSIFKKCDQTFTFQKLDDHLLTETDKLKYDEIKKHINEFSGGDFEYILSYTKSEIPKLTNLYKDVNRVIMIAFEKYIQKLTKDDPNNGQNIKIQMYKNNEILPDNFMTAPDIISTINSADTREGFDDLFFSIKQYIIDENNKADDNVFQKLMNEVFNSNDGYEDDQRKHPYYIFTNYVGNNEMSVGVTQYKYAGGLAYCYDGRESLAFNVYVKKSNEDDWNTLLEKNSEDMYLLDDNRKFFFANKDQSAENIKNNKNEKYSVDKIKMMTSSLKEEMKTVKTDFLDELSTFTTNDYDQKAKRELEKIIKEKMEEFDTRNNEISNANYAYLGVGTVSSEKINEGVQKLRDLTKEITEFKRKTSEIGKIKTVTTDLFKISETIRNNQTELEALKTKVQSLSLEDETKNEFLREVNKNEDELKEIDRNLLFGLTKEMNNENMKNNLTFTDAFKREIVANEELSNITSFLTDFRTRLAQAAAAAAAAAQAAAPPAAAAAAAPAAQAAAQAAAAPAAAAAAPPAAGGGGGTPPPAAAAAAPPAAAAALGGGGLTQPQNQDAAYQSGARLKEHWNRLKDAILTDKKIDQDGKRLLGKALDNFITDPTDKNKIGIKRAIALYLKNKSTTESITNLLSHANSGMWQTISSDISKINNKETRDANEWYDKTDFVTDLLSIIEVIKNNDEIKQKVTEKGTNIDDNNWEKTINLFFDEYAFNGFLYADSLPIVRGHGILHVDKIKGAHYIDSTFQKNFLATALCELVDFVCICKDMFNFYNVQGKTKPKDIDQYLLKYTFPAGTVKNVTNLFEEPGLFSKTRIEDLISQCYDEGDDEHKHLSTLLDGIMKYLKVTDEITPAKEDSQFTKFSGGEEGDIKNLEIIQNMINSEIIKNMTNGEDVENALVFFYPPEGSPDADTSANIRAANAVAALIHAPQRNIVSKFVIEQFRIAQQALKKDLQEMKVLAMSQTANTLAVQSGPGGPPVGTGGQFATLDIASLPFSFRLNK